MGNPTYNAARNKVRVASSRPVILWLRQDLRLADQPALVEASKKGVVIPVYILDNETDEKHKMGGASLWWLHHSLDKLGKQLDKLGSKLVLKRGESSKVLQELVKATNAAEVHAIQHYEPWWVKAQQDLHNAGVKLILHDGNQLMPPGSVTTGSNKPFKIYTPFWNALLRHMPPAPCLEAPKQLKAPEEWPESDELESWGLLPTKPNWAKGFEEWNPGEEGAMQRLMDFVPKVKQYSEERNMPQLEATSRLSPHMHFGEISPRQIWHAMTNMSPSTMDFLNEVGWRDYAQNVIMAHPDLGWKNGRPRFDKLPWRWGDEAMADLKAWKKGRTGYPIVDAGMRQLWETGWMHNRLRMITASFLVKHLLVDWRLGEEWFWDCLVDADYGSNSTGWQWVAGCGIDAQMWSRVMAPITQSAKFKAEDYIRRWVPELRHLGDKEIHDPEAHGVRPDNYPPMIVAHKVGRERALNAYEHIRAKAK